MFRRFLIIGLVLSCSTVSMAVTAQRIGCVDESGNTAICSNQEITEAITYLNTHLQEIDPNAINNFRQEELRRAGYAGAGGISLLGLGWVLTKALATPAVGAAVAGGGILLMLTGGAATAYYSLLSTPPSSAISAYLVSPAGYPALVEYLRHKPEYIQSLANNEPHLAEFLVSMKQIAEQSRIN